MGSLVGISDLVLMADNPAQAPSQCLQLCSAARGGKAGRRAGPSGTEAQLSSEDENKRVSNVGPFPGHRAVRMHLSTDRTDRPAHRGLDWLVGLEAGGGGIQEAFG